MSQEYSYAIDLRGITKEFPGVKALDAVDFQVAKGEVHGLVGENGAGKSTLIKIIAGVYQRDAGEMYINGEKCGNLTPSQVENLGVQFIHQDRNLVPDFSVAQSIFLGQELVVSPFFPVVDTRKMKKQAEEFILETMGVEMDGSKLIRDLPIAQKQIVQIAKALMAKPAIIAFDEPTAPLARQEIDKLFEIINNLKAQGITVIYISHYLNEIIEICDQVTVLRNGKKISTKALSKTTHDEIVAQMVGREMNQMFSERSVEIGEPLLEVNGISKQGEINEITFDVKRGEVVGITGLLGSGRHYVAEALYGLRSIDSGSVILDKQSMSKMSAKLAVRNGMGLVPRDRRSQGLVLNMSMNDNINLASLNKVSSMSFLKSRSAEERTEQMVKDLEIRPAHTERIVRYLSGGNQQKVVLGKWLCSDVDMYIMDEPTVGVDVGAKAEIYHLINDLVAEGSGIVMISSDLLELIGTTDRILVMFRGEIVKELITKESTAEDILFWATGGKEEENDNA